MRVILLFAFAVAVNAAAEVTVRVDRNAGESETPKFRFEHLPSPAADDAATTATIELIAGRLDHNSAALTAINDGRLPTTDDEPSSNLFFAAGTWGGRFRIDLHDVKPIASINTYSWHPSSRASQLYKVYGADGAAANFNASPDNKTDPATAGWKLIAFVDTRPPDGDTGGQYAVSISDTTGTLGNYRYLLFDCFETEAHDWSNTFYSEIDVIASKASSTFRAP